jgi:rare lipoprotein A
VTRTLPLLLAVLALGGCDLLRRGPQPQPHYVVGAPYRAGGVWRYPRESFTYVDTGLATVYDHGPALTADGEAFDGTALAAAHPTLQLPALARITNLENGRQVLVRLNDRGPADPARLIAVTRRTATLLAAANPAAFRVRVQVQEAESRSMAGGLRQAGPTLAVATAPPGRVQAETLAPPPGAAQSNRVQIAAAGPAPPATSGNATGDAVPARLPEQVWLTAARPGALAVECGSFTTASAAGVMSRRLAALGARVATDYNASRDRAYTVRISGLPTVQAAEAMLQRALASNAPDARIIVE